MTYNGHFEHINPTCADAANCRPDSNPSHYTWQPPAADLPELSAPRALPPLSETLPELDAVGFPPGTETVDEKIRFLISFFMMFGESATPSPAEAHDSLVEDRIIEIRVALNRGRAYMEAGIIFLDAYLPRQAANALDLGIEYAHITKTLFNRLVDPAAPAPGKPADEDRRSGTDEWPPRPV